MKRLPLLLLVIVLANPTNHLSGQSKTDPTARQARTIATERVPDMVLINRDQDRSQALAWFETMKKFDGRSATQSEIVSWYQYRLDWHQQRAPMGAIWKAVVVGATLAVGGVTAGIGRVGGLYTIDQMQESESLRLRSMRPEFKRLGRDNPETAMTLAKLILTKNAKAPDKTLVASFKNHPRALLSESVDESEGSHFERLAKGAIRSGENLRLHPKDAKALEEARQVTAKMNSMLDSFKRAQELENKGMSLVGLNEQERVRILNDITNVTNSAKQLGVLTHLSSDQQQQLDTAMNTVQLAATLIFATMTPTGYISTGLALATTLFGGSANQDPMQGVQAQLATISKQLQELQKSVNNLHQDVITGFSNISNELGEIRRQLDEQNALIRSGLEDVIAEIREISARDREKDWASLESEIDVYAKAKTSDERRVASDRVDRAFNQLMVSARLDGKAQAIAGPGLCWQRLHGDLAKDDLNAVDQEARRLVRDVNTATFGNRANCFFGMSQTVLDLLKVVNVPAVDLAAGPIAGTVISITEIGQDKPYQLIASTPLMEGEEDSEFGNPLLPVRLFRGGQLANASPFFVATFVQRGSAVLDRIPDATKRKELRLKLYAEFEPMIRSYGILHGRASASVLAGAYGRVQVALEEDLELMYRNPLAVALRDMDAWWDEFAQMFATPRNVIEQLGPLPKEPAPTAFTSNQADWYCYSSESLTQCLDRHAGPAVVKQLGGVIETPGIQRRRAIEKAKTVFTNRSQQVGSTMKRLLDNYIRHQQALRKAVGSVDGGQIQTPSVTINQVTSPFDPFVTFSSPQVTNDPPLPSETTAQAERAQLAGRSIYEVTRVSLRTWRNCFGVPIGMPSLTAM